MYKLYGRKGTASFAVEALLEEIGADYEPLNVEARTGADALAAFRKLNPLGQVPVLVLPDGTVMSESAAIMIYLAEAHPQAGLAPEAGTCAHARFLRWIVFMAANVYIDFRHCYHGDGYSPDAAHWGPMRDMALANLERDFTSLEAALTPGPYMLGESFSAADIYLAMFPDWHPEPDALLSRFPRIASLRDKVLARPAVDRAYVRHS